MDEARVVRGFALSDEFTGKNDNVQSVNTLSFALLGRNADPAGFASWKGNLETVRRRAAGRKDLSVSRRFEQIKWVSPRSNACWFWVVPRTLPAPGGLPRITQIIGGRRGQKQRRISGLFIVDYSVPKMAFRQIATLKGRPP